MYKVDVKSDSHQVETEGFELISMFCGEHNFCNCNVQIEDLRTSFVLQTPPCDESRTDDVGKCRDADDLCDRDADEIQLHSFLSDLSY